ncbi:MAG: sensor histidine kinase [Acidimicrobiia bacterium]|nr:sensor histidine kinase [Acidimicrobiia bacterium]
MLQEPKFLSADQFLLTTLVVKLAAMAALATMLTRYRRFRHILIFEQRNWPDRLVFALGLAIPITAGVAARVLLNYDAADLTLEGALLAGLIAGPYTGAIVGLSLSMPAFAAGEYGAPFFAVGCGFAGGGIREACPKEDIWSFSPFMIFSLPRHVWRMVRDMEVNWQVMLLLAALGLEFIRQLVGREYPLRLFHLSSPDRWLTLMVYIATVLIVSTPIKIWNNARIEHRLQEQEKLLLAAKVEALKSQINPHFLFNTLTSVSSLIRSQPETARAVIQKLSGLLRTLLQSQQQFVTLRDELAAIDEYLDIEVIRFGSRLRVRKSIAPETLDIIVPSLLLQPLVENCIKHGFARKVGPGTITIRSRRERDLAIIEIEDDGLGISDERVPHALSTGIGLSNVSERLRVLYGASGRFVLVGSPGKGSVARVELPFTHPIDDRITA